MMPNDFVWKQVYHGAMKLGANERIAKERACMASDKFRKSSYGKNAIKMIEDEIKEAVKISKMHKVNS